MRPGAYIVVVLLCLSVFTLLWTPTAIGQISTTVTQTQSVTNISTNTFYVTYTSFQTIFDNSVNVIAVPSQYTCYMNWFNFAGTTNQDFFLKVTSDRPISINILSSNRFQEMRAKGYCPNNSESLLYQDATKGFQQNFVTPSSDTYYLIFSNYDHNNDVNIQFTLNSWVGAISYYLVSYTTTTYRAFPNVRSLTVLEFLGRYRLQLFALIAMILLALFVTYKSRREERPDEDRTRIY